MATAAIALVVWVLTLAISAMYLRYAGLLTAYLKWRHPEVLADRVFRARKSPLLWAILFQGELFDRDTARLLAPTRALAAASAVGIAGSLIALGLLVAT